jgi:murein DD-endopeptidase MepM/ murein hydrolase activator NlpD
VEDVRFDKNANPQRNEDFAAFGQPILAPGSGRVARTRDGIPDNVPGQINQRPRERVGNFVVIDHGNGEYSLLAHLKNGSVKVRVGEKVAAGRKVGECGNSGNSSGPHLHYGLRGAPDPYKGMSLPAQFLLYLADGKLIKQGEPFQGQKIRHARR